MRILCIDTDSNALDWLMRCMAAGHDVLWYDKPKKNGAEACAGKGIIPKITDYDKLRSKYIDWANLIFLPDNTFYLDMLEPFQQRGYPIFGPTVKAAELELDRAVGQAAMKKAGLRTIPGVEFHDYDDAAVYVRKHPEYLVSKPSGDADKALSYVAPNAAALIYMLKRWKRNDKYRSDARKHGFILQQKITGAEVACGGWFGPGGWSKFWYENLENKKLFPGDLGPNTGELGTVSMYVRKSKLADIALKPFTRMLERLDYTGFIDIAGMVDEKGEFWPFEFTMRPGWPTFHNQMATHEGDPAQWMVDLLMGKDTLQVKENVACVSLVLAIPDWPYSHLTNKEVSGIPIYHADDSEHIHLSSVMLGDAPMQIGDKVVEMQSYVTCGDYVMVVTGTGETVTGARKSAYAAIQKVKIPSSPFWRTDIGRGRLVKDLPLLQKHGFATGFSF